MPSVDAAARRARMQVRVFSSIEEHDREDPHYWASLTVDQRVELVWTLSEGQWRQRGEYPDERGLPRSVARLHHQ